MKIITQTDPGKYSEFERDYIYNFLLKNAETIDSNKRIVVYSSNIRTLIPTDIHPEDVIVHLSNESLRCNYCFLTKDNIVLRSYYHPFLWKRNCYAIPLGWQTGFCNDKGIVGNHDKYIWTFIGQIKGNRYPMFESFKNITPNFSSLSEVWNSGTLSNEEVIQKYLDSAFALIPFGYIHADTIRVMETLEWGCIPVAIKYLGGDDYYRFIFGDHPFIVGKDWNDARRQVLTLWEDKELLCKKQKEVSDWYQKYKANLQADINEILLGEKPKFCEQWKYQKFGRLNLKLLVTWYYHFYCKNVLLRIKNIMQR